MAEGITYGGDFAKASGARPQDKLEILCSDPRFLERTAAKKPNPVIQFFQGAYSHPRDWWIGIIWCFMATGTFGGESQSQAQSWGRDLATILKFCKTNPKLAARIIGVYLKHQAMNSPEFYGRFLGGIFTNFASRGGRFGNRILSGPTKFASMSANLILATTGSMILSIKYGGKDIVSAFDAAVTGDYLPNLSGEQYKELFRAAMESDTPIPDAEAEALVKIVEGVLDCLNNPGSYVGQTEKGIATTPHVPVGQVSSARPNGVYGTIPRGSETNALDVLSEPSQ